MTEGKTYVEILLEKFFIKRIPTIFFLEGLIDKESSVRAATVQFIEPIYRNMDEFKLVRVCM